MRMNRITRRATLAAIVRRPVVILAYPDMPADRSPELANAATAVKVDGPAEDSATGDLRTVLPWYDWNGAAGTLSVTSCSASTSGAYASSTSSTQRILSTLDMRQTSPPLVASRTNVSGWDEAIVTVVSAGTAILWLTVEGRMVLKRTRLVPSALFACPHW